MKKITLIFLLLSLFLIAKAQYLKNDTTIFQPSFKFSFTPHYLIFQGLRLDYEKEFKPKQWYIISPTLYLGKNTDTEYYQTNRDNYYQNLYGAGLGVYYKYMLGNSNLINAYFSVGTRFNYFYIDYFDYNWITSIVDGNEVINYELVEVNEQILRLDGIFALGLETEIFQKLYMDTYFGLALRYSYAIMDGVETSNKFDDYMWNYAYTGTAVVLGLKIGITNKKY